MSARGVLRIIEGNGLSFYCPGCKSNHHVQIAPASPAWGFNGNYDKPTFTPSVLVRSGHYLPGHVGPECWCTYNVKHPDKPAPFECSVCHSFVVDGKIQFLSDSTHELAGQTVDLKLREDGGGA